MAFIVPLNFRVIKFSFHFVNHWWLSFMACNLSYICLKPDIRFVVNCLVSLPYHSISFASHGVGFSVPFMLITLFAAGWTSCTWEAINTKFAGTCFRNNRRIMFKYLNICHWVLLISILLRIFLSFPLLCAGAFIWCGSKMCIVNETSNQWTIILCK